MAARKSARKRRPSEDAPGPGIAYFATQKDAEEFAPKGFKAVRLEKGWAAVLGWGEFLDEEGESTHFGAMRLHGGGYLPGTPKQIVLMRAARAELESALRERRAPDMRVIDTARASFDLLDLNGLGMMIDEFRRKGVQISDAEVKKQERHEQTISLARCDESIRKRDATWKDTFDARDAEWREIVRKHKEREDALEGNLNALMKQCQRATAASPTSPIQGLLGKLFGGK
jgi:hypothetical protein